MHLSDSNKSAIAFGALLLGVFAISFGAFFVRFSQDELSPYAIAANRLFLSAIIFGLWDGGLTAVRRLSPDKIVVSVPNTAKTRWLLLIAGVLFFATMASVFWAQSQTSIAIAVLLHNLAPIFTSLAAWYLFGQTFDRQFVLGMTIALVGVGAIGWEEMQIGTSRLQGDVAAILSAVFLSAYLLIMEELRTQLSAVTIQLWICGIGAVVSIPLLILTQQQIFPHSLNTWVAIFGLACVCQVLGHGLLTFSLDRLSSVIVALVHLLEPVFASVLAGIFFAEQLAPASWVGFAIVLLGLYLAVLSQTKRALSPDDGGIVQKI